MTCFVGILAVVALFAGTQYGAGEIAREYRNQHANSIKGSLANNAQASRESVEHEIVRFGIERDGAFAYSIVVNANGECDYYGPSGLRLVYVTGDPCSAGNRAYTGRISPNVFKEVARSITDHGFFELEDAYVSGLTDVADTYTLVESTDATKVVRHHGGYGPSELATIERLIRGLVFEISWNH